MATVVRVGGQGVSHPVCKAPFADDTRSTSASSSTIVSVEYPASASTTSFVRIVSQACRCGATYAPGAKFCSECGAKVVLCSSCGAPFADGAKFCSECGAQRTMAGTKDFRMFGRSGDDTSDTESETISYGDIAEVYAFEDHLPEAGQTSVEQSRREPEQDNAVEQSQRETSHEGLNATLLLRDSGCRGLASSQQEQDSSHSQRERRKLRDTALEAGQTSVEQSHRELEQDNVVEQSQRETSHEGLNATLPLKDSGCRGLAASQQEQDALHSQKERRELRDIVLEGLNATLPLRDSGCRGLASLQQEQEALHSQKERRELRDTAFEAGFESQRRCNERLGKGRDSKENCALSDRKSLERDLPIAREVDKDSRRRHKEHRAFGEASEASVNTLEFLSQKPSKQQPALFPRGNLEMRGRPEKNRSGTPVPTGKRASVLNVQPLDTRRQSGYTKGADSIAGLSGGRGQLAAVPGAWDTGALRTKKNKEKTGSGLRGR